MPFPYGERSIICETAEGCINVPNSASEQQISTVNRLTGADSRDMFITAEVSGVSGVGGVIKLQQAHRRGATFVDVAGASVTITGNGTFEIEINREPGVASALKPYIRLVATTGGSDAFTVDRLHKTVRD